MPLVENSPECDAKFGFCKCDWLLNSEIFTALTEAEVFIEEWMGEYNSIRLHGSLGCQPPPEAVLT
jgi:hypothetical protein